MSSAGQSDPDREYRLIEQLELRIATADTDDKFQTLIHKFLPALLLKLASEHARNRNLAIKVCQYINQRLKINSSISLPVEPLVKTFREAHNAFVRRFALIFVEQGLGRLGPEQGRSTLPSVLSFSIPQADGYDNADRKMWAVSFDFLLDVLRKWKIPEHGSKEDGELRESLTLTEAQKDALAARFCDFLLFEPKTSLDADFQAVFEKQFEKRSSVILPISKFLFTAIFSDIQRLVPATILTVDANSAASSVGDMMFKQCEFNFEDQLAVDKLFALYKSAKPKLQVRILSILSKSKQSTSRTPEIVEIVEQQLSSSITGLEASRLRTAIFSYLTWTVRVSDRLGDMSTKVQDALRGYIETQGWPSMIERSVSEAELRAKAYESIGLLAAGRNDLNTDYAPAPTLDLIAWLFTSLRCDTTRDVRGSIEEALSRVMNVAVFEDQPSLTGLKKILLWNATARTGDEDPIYFLPTVNSTTYPATRFANKCLPFHDGTARLIDILAMRTSDRREVPEEGTRGLDPYWHTSNLRLVTGESQSGVLRMPTTTELIPALFGPEGLPSYQEYYHQPPVLNAAVIFSRNTLISEALLGSSKAIGSEADWKQRIDALVENDLEVRARLREYLQAMDQSTLQLLLDIALSGLSLGSLECAQVANELFSLAPDEVVSRTSSKGIEQCLGILFKSHLQHRTARVYGILCSIRPSVSAEAEAQIDKCNRWESAVGEAAVLIKGHLLYATFSLTRAVLRQKVDATSPTLARLVDLLIAIINRSSDKSMRDSAYLCLGQVCLCGGAGTALLSKSDQLINELSANAKKENETAVGALGRLIFAIAAEVHENEQIRLLDRVFALHEVRKAEFHFALGEALAVASAGFLSTSTTMEVDVNVDISKRDYHEGLMNMLIIKILDDCKTTKPSLKKATAIWLLSLVQFCGDLKPIKDRLREFQVAFSRLLNDRDEIVQETGSRGLSLVYERGDKHLRDDLVRDLVQSFTGAHAKMSGSVNEETQLFEAGALPTENGQSVTTYKDIVSLATEMGDPSLVYRFMNLASNNAIWTSRAAFGRFGLSNVLADSSYLTENKKFYPKLFRYRFDPNPNVQRSMNDIWRALVKDPTSVIDQNFDFIMDDLLKSVVLGKEWRAREASCAAIADLVQGREVEKFEKYLDSIWNVAFKVLDDVKESVRVAAMKLCRTLTSMLIRNLEVGEGTTKRARTMLGHAMPFLMQQMDGGGAKEVQQYAIVTLLEVVKKSPPKSLMPYAPSVLETLINSLSSLEHESINYLHLNADKYGLTAEKLDKMRVSSINASPVTEAIESCLESVTMTTTEVISDGDAMDGVETTSLSPMQDAMDRLVGCFKTAIGLPSKVGLSRVTVTLVVRHNAAFRPYADKFAQLTRKNILDRNATISVAFSMSLGYLMRLASEKEVRATSAYAQKLYFESQELAHRAVAGEILQAISKASNDIFMKFATAFLPFAFIGKSDTDAEVRERFDAPWKDNIGGSRALNLYLKEITDLTAQHLKSSLWPIRHACCFAVADLISSMEEHSEYSEEQARTLWPLMQEALGGKTWDGKERVVEIYPKFIRQAKSLWADLTTTKQMKTIAIREAKRTNTAYRPSAVLALGDFAITRRDLDLTSEVVEILTKIMDEVTSEDRMDLDAGEETSGHASSKTVLDETVEAVVTCLFKVLSVHAPILVLDPAMEIVQKASAQRSNPIDLTLYNEAAAFISAAAEKDDGLGARSGANENDKENVARANEEAAEAFSERLVLALLAGDSARHTSGSESLRRSRVRLALSLAQRPYRRPDMREQLASILDLWLQTERSRPLREDIEKAKVANQQPS